MPDTKLITDIPNFTEVQQLQADRIFLEAQLHLIEMKISILKQESPFWVWCDNNKNHDGVQ